MIVYYCANNSSGIIQNITIRSMGIIYGSWTNVDGRVSDHLSTAFLFDIDQETVLLPDYFSNLYLKE